MPLDLQAAHERPWPRASGRTWTRSWKPLLRAATRPSDVSTSTPKIFTGHRGTAVYPFDLLRGAAYTPVQTGVIYGASRDKDDGDDGAARTPDWAAATRGGGGEIPTESLKKIG